MGILTFESKKLNGHLTTEVRNNPDIYWVATLTIVVVKLTYGNPVNKHEYKQQHIAMYAHVYLLI